VLMLAQSYALIIAGEERVVQDLSRELVERGHSVAIATLCQESITDQTVSESIGCAARPTGHSCAQLDGALLCSTSSLQCAVVLSPHDYELICATKRLFYHGSICSGPGLLRPTIRTEAGSSLPARRRKAAGSFAVTATRTVKTIARTGGHLYVQTPTARQDVVAQPPQPREVRASASRQDPRPRDEVGAVVRRVR
jgi:hypothetical protein